MVWSSPSHTSTPPAILNLYHQLPHSYPLPNHSLHLPLDAAYAPTSTLHHLHMQTPNDTTLAGPESRRVALYALDCSNGTKRAPHIAFQLGYVET